jgi:hypothetical protein
MVLNQKEINIPSGENIDTKQKESGEMVDISARKEKELGGEAGHWLKKVEEYNSDPEGMIVRDGNIKMVPPDKISQDIYQIPLTKSNFVANLKKKKKDISSAITWLTTFLFRIIKLKKARVVFKEDESN